MLFHPRETFATIFMLTFITPELGNVIETSRYNHSWNLLWLYSPLHLCFKRRVQSFFSNQLSHFIRSTNSRLKLT
ncbi:unnamed protein product [Ixodes pacificus]